MIASKLFIGAAVSACLVATCLAFDPLTLTLGTTTYVATGTQVAVAVAAIAGLAIAKEKLVFAELSRRGRRGRRDIGNEIAQIPVNFASFFDAIAESDVSDCGKLLVCHAFAKNENSLTSEEKLVQKLFDDVDTIKPNTGYAEYQLAAYVGTFKQPEICVARYARCPVAPEALGDLIKV